MKAVRLEAPGDIGIKQIEIPHRAHGEALVKVRAAGICGSDIGAFKGVNPLISYPRIIGHEIAGEIVELGETESDLKVGDRVILDPYRFCGKCYPCMIGRTNCCENLKVIGVHIDGGMQEFINYPVNMLIPVSDSIAWEHVPIAEPLTIALHAIHRTRVQKGEHIAIIGAGAIGLLIAMCAMSYGAIPVMLDMVNERLEFAKKQGIQYTINVRDEDPIKVLREITSGRMAEVVIEASGSNSAIRNSLDLVSFAGRIALTGWPKKETSLPTDLITKKELDVLGSRTSAGEFEEALNLISTGKVDAKVILSKIVTLDDIPEMVVEQAEHPERYLKVNALL